MTKIHSPSGLFFLSPVKIGPRQAKKCLGVSSDSKIQMRMLSNSEWLGILIVTKDAFWPHVDVCYYVYFIYVCIYTCREILNK